MAIIVPNRWLLLIASLYLPGYEQMEEVHFTLLGIDMLGYCFVGNSANQAIDLLIRKGVPEDRIIFLNLISVCLFAHWMVVLLVISFFVCMTSSFLGAGSWRDSMRLQAISIGEDCNIRDRLWSEWGIQGHPWTGRVRRSLLWHRQLMAPATIESHLIPGEGWYIGRNVYCGRL